MSIRVDVFMASGSASGVLARAGPLRDTLEAGDDLHLERSMWCAIGETNAHPVGDLAVAVDEILIAVGDDDPAIPVHASWHAIRLEMGPYVVEGELPTLPGYDPGRALTRPNGEFLVLKDLRLGWVGENGATNPVGHVGLINRYAVDGVVADLMLGFYFPGAALSEARAVGAGLGEVGALTA
ncbi:MAG: hypothetical protein ABIP77_09495 [Candidatus Limnocylindrales bacterium]